MKSQGRKKPVRVLRWLVPVVVVVLGAGYVLLVSPVAVVNRGSSSQYQGTATVQTRKIDETVEVTGNIQPERTQSLQFPVGGQLARLEVTLGQRVEEGTLVAALNDTEARYELKSVENQIEKARVTGSTQDVQLLELEREVKLQNLDQMKIVARFDGVVGTLDSSVTAGDFLAAGQSLGSLVDLSSLQAEVEVDELDVPKLKVGQPVRFHFGALAELQVSGNVTAVPREGIINSQGIAVVEVTLTIPHPPEQIVPPFSFNADIVVRKDESILVVPSEAIITRNGQSFALVQKSGKEPEMTAVRVQPFETGTDQVLSGLTAGETILVLKPQARVSPTSSGFFGRRPGGSAGGGAPPGRGSSSQGPQPSGAGSRAAPRSPAGVYE
jgi:multidrug efflux pump subunit AcrA (membrane-fusion protein)